MRSKNAYMPRPWMMTVAAIVTLFVVVGEGYAQGVRYHANGAVNRIRFDDDLGLADADLYGGRVGIDFGRLVGLQGYYMRGTGLDTELSRLELRDNAGAVLRDQPYDLTTWGADLTLKFAWGRLVPYARAGAGILEFKPDGSESFEQITGKLGAGLEFDIGDGFRADVYAENLRFRMDRYTMAPGGRLTGNYPEDPAADDLRSSFSLGIAFGMEVGGSGVVPAEERWSFASIPIEPFVGRFEFDDDALGRRNVAGLRSGIDVGNYLGLRAFYWRGMNADFDDTERIRAYGGEAQFNINAGLGPAPYLVLGAGQLDFMDGFADDLGATRDDEQFLILGGGVGLRLTDNFRLNIAARDHLISLIDPEDVSRPDQLQHNWMFTAGLTFNLGRGRSRTEPDRPDRPVAAPTGVQPGETTGAAAGRTGAPGTEPAARPAEAPRDTTPGLTEMISTGRVVMIPVPERGELYVRYGEGGRLEVSRPEERVRVEMPAGTALTPRDLDLLVDAVTARVNAAMAERGRQDTEDLRRIVRDELERMNLDRRIESAVDRSIRETPEARPVVVERGREEQEPAGPVSFRDRLRQPSAYFGVGLSSPTSAIFGGRVQSGRVRSLGNVAIVPEFALGFADEGTSLLLAGNLEYEFSGRRLGDTFEVFPTVRAGLGFLSVPDLGTEGVLNLAYGFSSRIGESALRWFVEHQGIDLFDRNRIIGGVRWGF